MNFERKFRIVNFEWKFCSLINEIKRVSIVLDELRFFIIFSLFLGGGAVHADLRIFRG